MPSVKMSMFMTTILTVTASFAYAEEQQNKKNTEDYASKIMERVMVIGSADRTDDIAGSAHFIDKETLDNHNYTSIDRVLRQVPGVNIQEEEGYGNRPNIGLRGGRSERSADVTLMEDGILIAPAPYAAPSAYYFPRVGRMEAVEVRKGSSTIKFGPRTTSGAVNLISSSVPPEEKGELLTGYGNNNTYRTQAKYGDSYGNFGFVLDLGHESTDGFKKLDNGGDTGYSIQDVMGKFRMASDPSVDIYQSLELKLGYTQEDSDETYLGLSDEDFAATPFRRYAGSQKDNMDADHNQIHLRHFADFSDFDITTTLYRNNFARNWYKVQDVTVGGVTQNLGNAFGSTSHLNALKGITDLDGSAANNITLRANDREYYSTGLQSDLATDFSLGKTTHGLEVGGRIHYDEEDRFQQEDQYSIINGVMTLVTSGAPGSNANRVGSAKAGSFYILDEISYADWTFSPGIRYEYVSLKREDFNSNTVRKNQVSAFIPGMGISYAVNESVNLFGGLHTGFAPPSPGSVNDDEEKSLNYEAGVRYNSNGIKAELTGFFNDYSNLLGECTLSSGCSSGVDGDQFNAGEVDVFGFETGISYDFAALLESNKHGLSFPTSFNYTYTQAEFKNSFVSAFDEWGNVSAGDELPYIADHQFFASTGVVHPKWELHIAGKYVDEMRTQAGSGPIPSGQGTDANFIVDIAGEYEVYDKTRAFFTVDNLFDKKYIASRRPAGILPGRPLTLFAGVKYKF